MAERSPFWWLDKLQAKLDHQTKEAKKWASYFDGTQPLAFSTNKYLNEFQMMVKSISDNWMPIICEAVNERLHIDGFRFGDSQADDKAAWEIWQRNGLDSASELLHMDALKYGVSAAMVWVDPENPDQPLISVEHPSETFVAHAAGPRRERVAAIKRFVDEWDDRRYCYVYLPDRTYRFVTKDQRSLDWMHADTIPNPTGQVPVVAFRNRQDTFGHWRSELDGFTSTQDQINKLVADMIVASEYGAFRQRWATGLEIQKDPESGRPIEPFRAAMNRLWVNPNPDGRFGDFQATDLKPYIDAITSRIQSLASRSRTPPHYLLASGVFPNGESTKAAETGLISKVKARQRTFGEAWEDVMRLAFAMLGDPRKDEVNAEVIWADPESRTESEHIDSLVKQLAMGVPKETLWVKAGYTPQEIERMKLMLQDEALTQALANPLAIPMGELPSGTGPANT